MDYYKVHPILKDTEYSKGNSTKSRLFKKMNRFSSQQKSSSESKWVLNIKWNRKLTNSWSESCVSLENNDIKRNIRNKNKAERDVKLIFHNLLPNSVFNYARKGRKNILNNSASVTPNSIQIHQLDDRKGKGNYFRNFNINSRVMNKKNLKSEF